MSHATVGATPKGGRAAHWLRILKTFAIVDVKLTMSMLGGMIVTVVLLFAIPTLRPDSFVTMHLQSCASNVKATLQSWAAAENRAGRHVAIEELPAADAESTRALSARISYLHLGIGDYYRVWFADDANPAPPDVTALCEGRSFEFERWRLSVGATAVFVGGWYLAILGMLPFVLRREHAASRRSAPVDVRFLLRRASFGLLTASGAWGISALLAYAGVAMHGAANEELVRLVGTSGFAAACVVLVGPLCEETLFRGALLADFVAIDAPIVGSVIVGALFSAMHPIATGSFVASLAYHAVVFALSLALSWAYLRTRTVWASAIAHGVHNGVLVLLFTQQ